MKNKSKNFWLADKVEEGKNPKKANDVVAKKPYW